MLSVEDKQMKVTERLEETLREMRISKAELSRRLPRVNSAQQVSNWFSRGSVPPEHFFDICDAIGINLEWLIDGKGSKFKEQPNVTLGPDNHGDIPLISWVQAGAWCETEDPYQMGQAEKWLPAPAKCGGNSFILRVRGASMEPEYRDGELIYVDPSREPKHNDDVVVRLNNSGEATFKRLQIDGDQKYLVALNKQYPNPIIPLDEEAVICGVVFFAGRLR